MGEGKSKAARLATNNSQECDLARDAVALTREADILYAHSDFGAFRYDSEAPVKHKVDAIAYCVESEFNANIFAEHGNAILESDSKKVAGLASSWSYSGSLAKPFVTADEWRDLDDPIRKLRLLQKLTEGVISTKFLLMPYMPTLEGKADLYRNYVF
jgi:hypothetical protein